jgi:hypothetical protein
MTIFKVGDRVQGKSKALQGRHGVVENIIKESKHHKYDVQWDGGSKERIASRGLEPEITFVAMLQPEIGANTPLSTSQQTGLIAANSSNILDQSDSETTEDNENGDESEDSDEREVGELIIAHEREWSPCKNVDVDRRATVPPYYTTFKWPQWLELGDRKLIDFFYLMYPLCTVKETLRLTSAKLTNRKQRVLTEGELFKWLGIRLAMTLQPRRGPMSV